MKNSIIILITAIVMGCSSADKPISGVNIDAGIRLQIIDKDKNDLLNPNNPNALNLNNLHLYNVIDGKEVEVYNPLATAAKGFSLLIPEGKYTNYMLSIPVNIEDKSTITTILLKWSKDSVDTIKTYIARGDNYVIATKYWYNDILIYDTENHIDLGGQGFAFYEIVK